MKRTLGLLIFLLALQSTPYCVSASYELNTSNVNTSTQFEALDNRWFLDMELADNEELQNSYAGVYINTDNVLVICVTGNIDAFKTCMGDVNVIYRLVDHNVEKLERTNAEMIQLLGQYGIRSIGLSHSDNCVVVSVDNEDEIPKIKENVDCSAVVFDIWDPEMQVVATLISSNGNLGELSPESAGTGFMTLLSVAVLFTCIGLVVYIGMTNHRYAAR